jgi:predicted dehydrogenase
MIGIGLVGYGYWGPNLARNFAAQPDCRLVAICELQKERARLAGQRHPGVLVTPEYDRLLENPAIDAVVIATPVRGHYPLARRALLAGKDVLVEKPITESLPEAEELIRLAADNGRILAVDHTYLFSGAVQKIKEIVDSGDLGQLLYFDSVRINLGLFQPDVNVIYDLAPHDLSILCYLVEDDPVAVWATGASQLVGGLQHMAYLHLEYSGGLIAHFHLNWMAPVKMRRTLLGGTRKMIVYDDMEPSEKVKVYDKGIVLKNSGQESLYKILVDYRTGDMVAPKLAHQEALQAEAEHFIHCVQTRSQPRADGTAGLRVLRILHAAAMSLQRHGRVELGVARGRAA